MSLRPVAAGERIEVLDALRGAALFGIIAANMRGFSGPLAAYFDHTVMWTDPVSRVAQAFVDIFIQGKFITLFAFMFGIGFAIQMERADRSGVASRMFYVRRLAILLLFGLLHFILIWWGDILSPYAILGFALLLFRNRSQKALLRWSVGLFLYPLLMATFLFTLHSAGVQLPAPPPTTPEELRRIIGVYASGSYGDIVRQNLKEAGFMVFGFIFFYPRVLGVFLFGLWVWREGIIRELPSKTALLRRCQKYGLWIGLLFNSLAVGVNEVFHPNPITPSVLGLLVNAALTVGVPAGSLFYATTVALLWEKLRWRERLRPFAAVGKMALTNYLLQSVVCTTLFYSWGLALYGRVNPLIGLVPTILIYGAQVALSVWWFRRFAMGPMEWLWRRLTYGANPSAIRVV
ncbi:MAG TPA: DUF418 domain-containing protein [Vicinamibacterales bacterium]|nr:DUF418 domain-containing protein [Vicinamibacterales bacterium]